MFFNRHNNYDDYYGPNTPGMEYSSAMSTAAFILAFLSIFSSLMFYIAVPAGALSILLALLSRGRNRRLTGKSRIAVFVSVVGITASAVTTVMAVHTVMTNPGMRSQLEYMFNSYAQELGLDIEFDDYFGNGGKEKEDDASDSVPDDDDLANDYFNRYYGNDGSLPGSGGSGDSTLPGSGGNGNNAAPDISDIFNDAFPDDGYPYWYGSPEPGGGGGTSPSGSEYI